MRKRLIVCQIAIGISFGLNPKVGAARDLNPMVYRILAQQCALVSPNLTIQTGFLMEVNDTLGLVTALHGVVGCNSIYASNEEQDVTRLAIHSIDIEHDVAFLSGPEFLHDFPQSPLRSAGISEQNQDLKVIGYPQAILTQISHPLQLHETPLQELNRKVPPGPIFRTLDTRGSPSLNAVVVLLRGPLQEGYSGAPISDSLGRVVAVGLGGLKGGTVDINWAVPYDSIIWERSDQRQARLIELARLDPSLAFSMRQDDAQIDSDRDGVPDGVEFELGTHPDSPDSDGDGQTDRLEIGNDPDEPARCADGKLVALDALNCWRPSTFVSVTISRLKVGHYQPETFPGLQLAVRVEAKGAGDSEWRLLSDKDHGHEPLAPLKSGGALFEGKNWTYTFEVPSGSAVNRVLFRFQFAAGSTQVFATEWENVFIDVLKKGETWILKTPAMADLTVTYKQETMAIYQDVLFKLDVR